MQSIYCPALQYLNCTTVHNCTSSTFVAASLGFSISIKIKDPFIAFFWARIAHPCLQGIFYEFKASQWHLLEDRSHRCVSSLSPCTLFSMSIYSLGSSINPMCQAKELRLSALLQQIRSRSKCQATWVSTLFLNLFYCRA